MGQVYKLATVRRLTGFSGELLRAWERRYGLLQPVRGPGGHRLYTEEDLRLLRRVRELLAQGRTIGEIAALGRRQLLRAPSEPLASADDATLAELERLRGSILEAVRAVDAMRLRQLLDATFARVSPDVAIGGVLEPAARQIGELWAAGQCSVASEHLASEAFVHRLRQLMEAAQAPDGASAAVTACFPDERHQLGLLIVGYELARQGYRVVHLGPALPVEDLDRACEALQPRVVVLSVTLPSLYQQHRDALAELVRRRADRTRWILGGQGVPARDPHMTAAGALLWPHRRPLRDLADLLP
ncbi:MAG TPA: MerR family transcriptional regulator [Bryobacteraceae bacterium]|nr:MerR family transcriptional regulator [Bryobacteraceae bacterium]